MDESLAQRQEAKCIRDGHLLPNPHRVQARQRKIESYSTVFLAMASSGAIMPERRVSLKTKGLSQRETNIVFVVIVVCVVDLQEAVGARCFFSIFSRLGIGKVCVIAYFHSVTGIGNGGKL
jgi:hypothetical protein